MHTQSLDTLDIVFIYGKQLDQLLECVSYLFQQNETYTIFPLQSFRLAFALVMGVMMFMMMSLRHGKDSYSTETDIFGCPAINLC